MLGLLAAVDGRYKAVADARDAEHDAAAKPKVEEVKADEAAAAKARESELDARLDANLAAVKQAERELNAFIAGAKAGRQ